MLIELERELGAEVNYVIAHEAHEEGDVEVVVANAVAKLAIEVLALCPEGAGVDALFDDVLGDAAPAMEEEERRFVHDVGLGIGGRGTVPIVVEEDKGTSVGPFVPGGRILRTGEIGIVDEELFFLLDETTCSEMPGEIAGVSNRYELVGIELDTGVIAS